MCWRAPDFDPGDTPSKPAAIKGRTVVLSDVHIGNGYRTCWYQRSVHEPYLAAVLDYVITHAIGPDPVTRLVLLGDFFDLWTYPPDQRPPSMAEIIKANQPILGAKGKLREVAEALGGNVFFQRGNHDMEITQKDLDLLPLGKHSVTMIEDLVADDSGLVLTHGHLFTMFNAPDRRYPGEVPVGHFVTRAIAHYLDKTLAPGQTAADLHDQGSPYGFDLSSFVPAFASAIGQASVTSLLLDYMANKCGLNEDVDITMRDGAITRLSAVRDKYDGLWNNWAEMNGGGEAGLVFAAKSAYADYDGTYMAWYAQKAAFDNGTAGTITGHTHVPHLGIVNSRTLYANCGFECPSTPDLAGARTGFTFGIIADGVPALWAVVHEQNGYCVKPFRAASPDRVVFEPASDFSCYVSIHNGGGETLIRTAMSAENGFFVSAPAARIAPGTTMRFWVQDFPGIHGAEGTVTYEGETSKGTWTFEFGCPTGIFPNYARGGSSFVASSSFAPSASTPAGSVPNFGHPLFIDFDVAADAATGPAPWEPRTPLAHAVVAAGFRYDPSQDIIYSRMDALQRSFGYAYGYDAAALLMDAIIDCEPIFFDYGGKSWMIELWKGQYGLETGCEIGVYNRPNGAAAAMYPILDPTVGARPIDPDPSHSRFFDCAPDSDLLRMSSTLYRDGVRLFSRGPERHWWLTGFKWGVWSSPEQLTMDVSIECLDVNMTSALTGALAVMGYTGVQVSGNTVSFVFDTPKAPQPRSSVAPSLLAAVRSSQQAIVAGYSALNLTSNDPNTVGDQAAATIGTKFAIYTAEFFGSVIAHLAEAFGIAVQEAIDALVLGVGLAVHEVGVIISNVGYAFSTWISDIGKTLADAFNFACIIEVSNRGNNHELILKSSSATSGTWAVEPPVRIPAGGVGRFWLLDPKGSVDGSKGSATYTYDSQSVTFSFSDPTGLDPNEASSSSSDFGFYTKSGSVTKEWGALKVVAKSGHPFFVTYTWQNGPIPPDA